MNSSFQFIPLCQFEWFSRSTAQGKVASRTLRSRKLGVITMNSALLDTNFLMPRKSTRSDHIQINMTPMSVRVVLAERSEGQNRIENPWATNASHDLKEQYASRYKFSRASKIHSKWLHSNQYDPKCQFEWFWPNVVKGRIVSRTLQLQIFPLWTLGDISKKITGTPSLQV